MIVKRNLTSHTYNEEIASEIYQSIIDSINSVFSNHSEITKAILYGLRAKGTYKNGSDIDITIKGDDLTLQVLYKIMSELDDLLPYEIDLKLYQKIDNLDQLDHINRVGKVFYKRQ